MKEFNVTGLCVSEKHYMVAVDKKIDEIKKMVEKGSYFTINRPRQYGKTTTLYLLSKRLIKEGYIVIDSSFEGMNDLFNSSEEFCKSIFELFADNIEMVQPNLANILREKQKEINNYRSLSYTIKNLLISLKKKVILLIDEVDKCSDSKVFLEFLSLLRNKYLASVAGKDITFHSVILAGVHDIKNLKISIRNESDHRLNSPWNIAEDFLIDMSFSSDDISSMLIDYCKEKNIDFNIDVISNEIFKYTNGYPYLVSSICKFIDERLNKNWSILGVLNAVKILINEKSTLFDDVIKNIKNDTDIKDIVHSILVKGYNYNYNFYAYETGIIYGLFINNHGKLIISNKIYEELLYNYLLEETEVKKKSEKLSQESINQFINGNELNMERIMLKFKEFMYEEYREEDEKFYETNGRMIFLSFLKPILNGKGFRFIEPVTRLNKRMDLILTYDKYQYVVEMKIWNGKIYEEKGINQLIDYLDIHRQKIGYLIIFNFNKKKKTSANWLEINGKRIFEIIV
ncbi:MAG: AAA-like domain-containing protein [Clostridiales bacterium]